jgi:hypothetical protein
MLDVTAQMHQLNAHIYLYNIIFTIFLLHFLAWHAVRLQGGLLAFLLNITFCTRLLCMVTCIVKSEIGTKFYSVQ